MRNNNDFAVGSDVISLGYEDSFGEDDQVRYRTLSVNDDVDRLRAMSDEEPNYRSFDMPNYRSLGSLDVPALISENSAQIEVDGEELVYRSLGPPPLARRSSAESASGVRADADASWLAAGRPPLLQRQRAFNRGSESDMDLMLDGL